MDQFSIPRPLMSDQDHPTAHLHALHQRNGGSQERGIPRFLNRQPRDR